MRHEKKSDYAVCRAVLRVSDTTVNVNPGQFSPLVKAMSLMRTLVTVLPSRFILFNYRKTKHRETSLSATLIILVKQVNSASSKQRENENRLPVIITISICKIS